MNRKSITYYDIGIFKNYRFDNLIKWCNENLDKSSWEQHEDIDEIPVNWTGRETIVVIRKKWITFTTNDAYIFYKLSI